MRTYSVVIRFSQEIRAAEPAAVEALAQERGVSFERVPFLDGRGEVVRITHPARWVDAEVTALEQLYEHVASYAA